MVPVHCTRRGLYNILIGSIRWTDHMSRNAVVLCVTQTGSSVRKINVIGLSGGGHSGFSVVSSYHFPFGKRLRGTATQVQSCLYAVVTPCREVNPSLTRMDFSHTRSVLL